jgi:hypothetical protein
MVVFTTGMWSASSASNTALKFSLVPIAVRQYAFVSMENTPTSLLFSKCRRCAMARDRCEAGARARRCEAGGATLRGMAAARQRRESERGGNDAGAGAHLAS